MTTKKIPLKKKPVTKAAGAKITTKKAATKNPVALKKTPTKKKHVVRRILDFKLNGWVSKKTLIISGSIIVLAVGAFVGYNILQDSSANAGGSSTLGRGWTSIGSVTTSATYSTSMTAKLSACRIPVKKGYQVKASAEFTEVKGTINANLYVTNNGTSPSIPVTVGRTVETGASSTTSKSTVTVMLEDSNAGGGTTGLKVVKISSLKTCR